MMYGKVDDAAAAVRWLAMQKQVDSNKIFGSRPFCATKLALLDFAGSIMKKGWTLSNSRKMFVKVGSRPSG
jgi:hypothetical protein